jgi:hypothetical protein
MENEILTNYKEEDLGHHGQCIRNGLWIKAPRKLPVVSPSVYRQANKVDEYAIENRSINSVQNSFPPSLIFSFPWPWFVLLNFVLFDKWNLQFVNDVV